MTNNIYYKKLINFCLIADIAIVIFLAVHFNWFGLSARYIFSEFEFGKVCSRYSSFGIIDSAALLVIGAAFLMLCGFLWAVLNYKKE